MKINNLTTDLNSTSMIKIAEGEVLLQELVQEQKHFSKAKRNGKQAKESSRFPIEALPISIQKILFEFHKVYQLPLNYFSAMVFPIIGSIIGNTFRLKYKEGFEIPPITYFVLIGNSSIGKTPAINLLIKPLLDLEKKYNEQYQEELIEFENDLENGGSKKKPKRKEMILNDATMEATYKTLQQNQDGILLIQDELVGWINNMNQYRNGNDEQFWLSNWSSQLTKVSRATKETLFIQNPCISVVGGTQPELLKNFGKGEKKANGFLVRMLFVFSETDKKPYDNDLKLNPNTISEYNYLIRNVFQTKDDAKFFLQLNKEKNSIAFEMDNQARKIYLDWTNENTDLINSEPSNLVKALYGKLANYCLRFCLILKVLELSEQENINFNEQIYIEPRIVENAIKLTEYFRGNSLRVLDILENIDPINELTLKEQDAYNTLPEKFTTAQGVKIASKFDFPERSFKRFLNNKFLFRKIQRGIYQKLI